jgi:hypothetical protein
LAQAEAYATEKSKNASAMGAKHFAVWRVAAWGTGRIACATEGGKPHAPPMGGANCDHKFVALRLNKSKASTIKVMMTYIQSRSSAKAKTENATRATGVAMRIKIPS